MKPNWKQGMKNHARSISTSNSNTAANSLKNITDKVTITPVLGTGMAQEMLLKWSNNNNPQSMQASHTHDNCEYIDSKGNCDLRL